jgi:hypothetical protein
LFIPGLVIPKTVSSVINDLDFKGQKMIRVLHLHILHSRGAGPVLTCQVFLKIAVYFLYKLYKIPVQETTCKKPSGYEFSSKYDMTVFFNPLCSSTN